MAPRERTAVLDELDRTRRRKSCFVFSYVVMPSHVHFVVWPQTSNLTDILREFKSNAALRLARMRATAGPLWQPRFFEFICRRVSDFHERIAYIHNNPVEGGLVRQPEEWPWSSAGWYLRGAPPPIPVDQAELPADGNSPLWPVHRP